jgi:hypothetical protein
VVGFGDGCHSGIGGAEFGDDCGCEAYLRSTNSSSKGGQHE